MYKCMYIHVTTYIYMHLYIYLYTCTYTYTSSYIYIWEYKQCAKRLNVERWLKSINLKDIIFVMLALHEQVVVISSSYSEKRLLLNVHEQFPLWMNKLKKNHLIKARKPCNIFRFIDDLNSINDGGKFESNYSNI